MPVSRLRLPLIVGVLGTVLYAALAAPVPFYDKGEPREALVVRALLDGDSLILPRREGRELPAKPPLFHWLAALAVRAGVRPEELAHRAPSVVFGAAGLALSAHVAADAYGPTAGLLSAIVLGSSLEWLRSATQSRVDMTLTFFVAVAILAWHAAVFRGAGTAAVRLGWLSVAAAALSKGPVGAALPILVLTVAALMDGRGRSLRRLLDLPSLGSAVAIVGGWYVIAWRSGGSDFASLQLLHENVDRFVGWDKVAHEHGAFYYPPVLAGAFLPWTLVLPSAIRAAWRRGTALDRFLFIWIVAILVFYSLAAGKRSVYLLPIFPPLAILSGTALAAVLDEPLSPWSQRGLDVTAAGILGVALLISLGQARTLVHPFAGFMGRTDVLRLPAVLDAVEHARWPIALSLIAGAGSLAVFARTTIAWVRSAVLVLIGLILTAGLTAFGTLPVARVVTPRLSAERLRVLLPEGARVCSRGGVEYAFRYYLGTPIPPCPSPRAASFAARQFAFAVSAKDGVGAGRRHYHATPLMFGLDLPDICLDPAAHEPASGAVRAATGGAWG